jgi:pimeloyl-ACP methyl ester carboxylesterase
VAKSARRGYLENLDSVEWPERAKLETRVIPSRERPVQRSEVELHGHRFCYRAAGQGPAVVLLHGIAASSATWERVIPRIAGSYWMVAPDLLGHGESAKPRGDYSVGAYANLVRDLLDALGVRRCTIVGHSLGGGVAMQFVYQFPERCERLALVASGGLGRMGSRASADLEETWRSFIALGDREARRAFLETVREVVDLKGQHLNGVDRLYLAAGLPTLIIWGERDRLIPVSHAHVAHRAIAGSRLEIFPGSGHFPFLDAPERFAATLLDFLRSTAPSSERPSPLRLKAPPPAPPPEADSAR